VACCKDAGRPCEGRKRTVGTMTESKAVFVADLAAGDRIDDFFVLAEKNMAHKRDGNPFLNVTIADKSGRIRGVVWDDVPRIAAAAQIGDVVRVSATVGEYRGALQLVIKSVAAVADGQAAPDDFLPASGRDADQMFDRLKAAMDTLKSPYLQALIQALWDDPDLVDRFKRAPAAKKMHHAYIGGLLEHTLSMVLLADKIAGHYSGVDREVLMVGAVVHDIGKLRELSYRTSIDYTNEGRLLSHITIGIEMVSATIAAIDGFPTELADLIKHMIVSHHGSREFGSPEPPKTIEAVLLNYIDEIDSRVNAIREFMAADEADPSWTAYHRLLERQFFKGGPTTTGV
jgi:3'-5' exoribonuclease